MGTGQSQGQQGGQMGGMGQPGGIPGGGIAGLAPQMGGQMGGFGQMVNQAVAQPGMAAPGGGFSPMTNMGGFMGGNPAMPAPGGMPPRGLMGGMPAQSPMMDGSPRFSMLDQAALQAQMQAQMQQDGMGGRPPGGQRPINPRTGAPVGVLVSQPPSMFGGMMGPKGGPPPTMVNPRRPMPGGQTQGGQMGGMMGGMGPRRPISPNVPSTMQRGMPQGLASMFKGRR